MSVKIYIEGGGDTDALRSELRQGFQSLFEKAGFQGRLPKVVACGSRNDAFDDFKTALKNKKDNEIVLLLVDSEEQVNGAKWNHVKNRDGDQWEKPALVDEENIYFMVECMESWFLADKNALSVFYGEGFNANALPKTMPLEAVAKQVIYDALKLATKNTQKGEYGKGAHSFKILGALDATKVKNHGSYSKDFFDYLETNL